MEDIFAVDDKDVETITRREVVDEYSVPEEVIASRPIDERYDFNFIEPRRVNSPPSTTNIPLDLGDDEVVIKSRPAIAKLDEERLCSNNGIPKLMKKKFKFSGKGRELEDLGRIIEYYQFWCHELYPRAKFGDCLGIIRKLGKTKSMKSRRRAFIDSTLEKQNTEVVNEEDFEMSDDASDMGYAPSPNIPRPQVTPDEDDMDALEAMGVM